MSKQEILAELPLLSAEDRAELTLALYNFDPLRPMMGLASPSPSGPRVANLHAGAWEVADDFDAPLPDEFWLGEDA